MARVLIGWTDAHYMADGAGNAIPNVVLDVQVLGTGAAVTDLQPPTEYAGQAFPTGQARSDAAGYYGFTVPEGTPPVRVRAAARVVNGKTVPAGSWVTPSGQVLVDGPVKAAVAALEASLPSTYARRRMHAATDPLRTMPEQTSSRVICGIHEAGPRQWAYDGSGFYQADTLSYTTSWQSKTLPPSCSTSGRNAKVVVFAGKMYGCFYNTASSRYEVYSSPLVSGTAQPTWSSALLQMVANGSLIMQAFRATSAGLFLGEYTLAATGEIAAGPTVYRSTDGVTFTAALGPITSCRHTHGVFEDPYNPGHIYVTVGDTAPNDHWVYLSTQGGAPGTFAPIATLDNLSWQAVSMGFTEDYAWFCGDNTQGYGAYVIDRETKTPRWATTRTKFSLLPVPGGVGGRVLTDVSLTSGSAVMTSATGAFTAADKGKRVEGPRFLPHTATFIRSVDSGTQVTLSQQSNTTVTNQRVTVLGDTFYGNGYTGAVDPATGFLYLVANDNSVDGTVGGIFVLTGPDQPWTLLHPIFNPQLANYQTFIAGGSLWVGPYGPIPLLTAAPA